MLCVESNGHDGTGGRRRFSFLQAHGLIALILTHARSQMDSALTPNDRASIRAAMRRQRQATSQSTRRAAAHAALRHLLGARLLAPGLRIATYLPMDGELDPTPIAQYAADIGCRLYVPHIVDMRRRQMKFVEVPTRSMGASRLRFGRRLWSRFLDVVFVPVVAFDMHGHRLGFGAGFYDREFAFLRRGHPRRPLLIGVAFEFQRTAPLHPAPWDVPLDAVLTERGLHRCRRRLTY